MNQLTNSKLQKLMLVLLVAFGVSACGGGGGGGDSSTPEAPAPIDDSIDDDDDGDTGDDTEESEPETPGVAEPDISTDELVASDDMDFKSSEPVMVNIQMASGETAYASVYTEFSETPEGYLPSYQQRMASGPLTNGQLELSVSVGKERTHLLVEVWFYDPQVTPIQKVFTLNSNTLEWEI